MQPVLQVPVVPGVPLGPRPLPVMAREPLQQDQQLQLFQLGQAVPGVGGQLQVRQHRRRVEAQQHRVEHLQVDEGAGLVRVAVGLPRLVLCRRAHVDEHGAIPHCSESCGRAGELAMAGHN